MSVSDPDGTLWQNYGETIVEVSRNGRMLDDRQLYELWQKDFFMITAANPFSKKLSDEENEFRNLELYVLLALISQDILEGHGRDSTWTWVEKGWVLSADEEKLILLAKKFEQNAIFKFTAQGREIIDCR